MLQEDHVQFQKMFRVSICTFDYLCDFLMLELQ
jgi:hypothetical protein